MKLKEAIIVLVDHAIRDCQGVGRGIRTIPNDEERRMVVDALERVWPRIYGYTPTREEVERKLW